MFLAGFVWKKMRLRRAYSAPKTTKLHEIIEKCLLWNGENGAVVGRGSRVETVGASGGSPFLANHNIERKHRSAAVSVAATLR
jgi:hypothetical protein